jgi:hypothetical protein
LPMVDRLMMENVSNERFKFERIVIGDQVEG